MDLSKIKAHSNFLYEKKQLLCSDLNLNYTTHTIQPRKVIETWI